MNIKMWGKSFIAACLLFLAGAVQASIEDYNFTATGSWFGTATTPYGMPSSPTVTGSLVVDNVADVLTGFSLSTGSQTWTLSNVNNSSSYLSFGGGNLLDFGIIFSNVAGGNGYVYSNNTFAIHDASGDWIACNGCVSFAAGNAPAAPVPEPESYTMILAGLGLMGFLVRRKKTA